MGRRNEGFKWLQPKDGRGNEGRDAEVGVKIKKNIRCVMNQIKCNFYVSGFCGNTYTWSSHRLLQRPLGVWSLACVREVEILTNRSKTLAKKWTL